MTLHAGISNDSHRHAEYNSQHILHTPPVYTILGSTSTTSHPCHVGKSVTTTSPLFVPCSAQTTVVRLYFLFKNLLTALVSQKLLVLPCIYNHSLDIKRPRKPHREAASFRPTQHCPLSRDPFFLFPSFFFLLVWVFSDDSAVPPRVTIPRVDCSYVFFFSLMFHHSPPASPAIPAHDPSG